MSESKSGAPKKDSVPKKGRKEGREAGGDAEAKAAPAKDPRDKRFMIDNNDRKNITLFLLLSFWLWVAFNHFLIQPRVEKERQQKLIEQGVLPPKTEAELAAAAPPRDEVVAREKRVAIDNGAVFGSLSLRGARLDDLRLQDYYKTHDRAEHVELLSPAGAAYPKYAEFGWLSDDAKLKLPTAESHWRLAPGSAEKLTPDSPVTLYWDNGAGLRFTQKLELDKNFLFTVTQGVTNNGAAPVTLYPFSLIAEQGLPPDLHNGSIIHEGLIGYIGAKLIEHDYRKYKADSPPPPEEVNASKGWIGLVQNYWLATLIPDQAQDEKFRFVYAAPEGPQDRAHYQVDMRGAARTVAPGAAVSDTARAYLGAKKIDLVEKYGRALHVDHFDLTVDFGMWYFLTKPFYHVLVLFGGLTGNYGIAIILLTILVRLCVFPLANTSYRSFAKLKKISPKMKELRDKHLGDREALQRELVKLYEKEKVNPIAGCLPIVFQIPIFFALYKTLQLSIEIRHEPFFGWIHDLSAPDPTTVFNLFGLLPWTPPHALMIGAWPCLMLFFMLMQRQLNPPAQDKVQTLTNNLMPFFITFILSKFAAGLVIYWTFSNALSVLQQYIIMRSMGVEVRWFKRPPAEKALEKQVAEGPAVHPALGVIEDEVGEALFGDDSAPKISPPKKGKKKKK
jgi:YidC/Oxa1 family membrane protein insertase